MRHWFMPHDRPSATTNQTSFGMDNTWLSSHRPGVDEIVDTDPDEVDSQAVEADADPVGLASEDRVTEEPVDSAMIATTGYNGASRLPKKPAPLLSEGRGE